MAIQRILESPRILLLKNYPSSSPSDKLMMDSFLTNIQATVPGAHLDICCIANGELIPDLLRYHLVILSGGKVNLLEDEKPPWALQILEMVRQVAREDKGTKLLGICWGHQAIHYALGGTLAWLEDGPCIGVQDIQLTTEGQQNFNRNELKMHKYHVRYVSHLAEGFEILAHGNEISMSKSERILTFQGHPEMTYEIAKVLSDGDNGTYKPWQSMISATSGDDMLRGISTPHDGGRIWEFIMRWSMADEGT